MSILYDEQERSLALTDIAVDILHTAQAELYLDMRFLDVALSSLVPEPSEEIRTAGTDGTVWYFRPDQIAAVFRKDRRGVNRLYLHSILHCLFAHLWVKGSREDSLWDLACDIAVEQIIDTLSVRSVHRPVPAIRREAYQMLKSPLQAEQEKSSAGQAPPLSAQRICRILTELHLEQTKLDEWKCAFTADDHSRWNSSRQPAASAAPQQKWEDIRDRMQSEMEIFGRDAADDVKNLEEQICAAGRRHYDYRDFLRKFSVMKEEMQADPDSFDYIYYHYGMELYGNMPLIEPLETREVKKVEDFVIVLDTSMSCKGDLLLHFLEETYSILSESESFFRKIHIHILQCDDRVQEDVLITNREEMKHYLEHFTVRGFGGTDFRPAFARVDELLRRQCFTKLRGLIYFTDGYGTFPAGKPPYDTAFIFLREDCRDVDVPPWAIKLILDPEELEQMP